MDSRRQLQRHRRIQTLVPVRQPICETYPNRTPFYKRRHKSAVICVGKTTDVYPANLTASKSARKASFKIEDGLALSNAGFWQGTRQARPLNALVSQNLNQPFILEINSASEELTRMFDIVIYFEYTATFQ